MINPGPKRPPFAELPGHIAFGTIQDLLDGVLDPPPGSSPRLGTLAMTGWIGTDPRDGTDIPFLLLYSPGYGEGGSASSSRALLEVFTRWGVLPGSAHETAPTLPAAEAPVDVLLAGREVTVRGIPGFPPNRPAPGFLTRPVSQDWRQTALRKRVCVLAVVARPWPEGPAEGEAAAWRWLEEDATARTSVLILARVLQQKDGPPRGRGAGAFTHSRQRLPAGRGGSHNTELRRVRWLQAVHGDQARVGPDLLAHHVVSDRPPPRQTNGRCASGSTAASAGMRLSTAAVRDGHYGVLTITVPGDVVIVCVGRPTRPILPPPVRRKR